MLCAGIAVGPAAFAFALQGEPFLFELYFLMGISYIAHSIFSEVEASAPDFCRAPTLRSRSR